MHPWNWLTGSSLRQRIRPRAVDAQKRPVDIPFVLAPESQAEQLRHRLALQKRTERLALRDSMRRRRRIRVSLDGNICEGCVLLEAGGPGVPICV